MSHGSAAGHSAFEPAILGLHHDMTKCFRRRDSAHIAPDDRNTKRRAQPIMATGSIEQQDKASTVRIIF